MLATLLRTTMALLMLAAAARAEDGARLGRALDAADRRDYAEASALARGLQDPLARELVRWRFLQRGEGGFEEMAEMLRRRPDWPRMFQIREEAERAMPPGLSPAEVRAFFTEPPRTGVGALRLAAALRASGDMSGAQLAVAEAWRERPLTPDERRAMLRDWPQVTRAQASARLDEMLWRGDAAEARALLPLVGAGEQALAEARISLRERAPGVDARIARVPAALSNDPGLAFERFLWRWRSDLEAEAEQLLASRTGSAALLGRPEAWARLRAALARDAFRNGRDAEAYRLASLHHLTPQDGPSYSDLEFLAGWIALRGLRDPTRAANHFRALWDAVETPISKGRGGYWLARAYEASGDATRAREWRARAAQHPTSFYGQLSAEAIGLDIRPALREDIAPGPLPDRQDMARAARLLQQAGHRDRARWFLTSLAETLERPEDFAALGAFALELGRPDGAIAVAKTAARLGITPMASYYPAPAFLRAPGAVEPALALAVSRQESEMNPQAVSHAGARGLMQLMPGTAEKVARDLGIPHRPAALTADPEYNARLGKGYLAEMLARFDGAKALAAAAYNAGPSRVEQWIGRYGDPRRGDVDAIDWIESIPFSETRNYVQRVLEGLHVYRARLGEPSPDSFEAALTQAGS